VAIAGQTVTFTLNGVTRSAKTSSSGLAAVVTKAPTTLGTYPIKIAFAGNTTRAAASTTASLRVRVAAPTTSTTDQITAQQSGTSPLVLAGLLFLAALSLIAASRRYGDRREVR
jgi:hypothetical protein